jgi:hypothetical protein
MKMSEFEQLSQKEKVDLLQKDGAYVGKRHLEGQIAVLFQLYGFYAEIIYKDYRKNVNAIRTSEDLEITKPYLNQISLDVLDELKIKN